MEAKKSFFCSFLECRDRPPFSKNSNLTRHVNYMHSSENICSYEDCSEIFQNRKDLLFHEKKKHRVRCQLCNNGKIATFKTNLQLKTHIRLTHQKTKRHNVYFCIICDLSFPSKNESQLHNVRNHQSGGGNGEFVLHNTAMSGAHNDYRCEN